MEALLDNGLITNNASEHFGAVAADSPQAPRTNEASKPSQIDR